MYITTFRKIFFTWLLLETCFIDYCLSCYNRYFHIYVFASKDTFMYMFLHQKCSYLLYLVSELNLAPQFSLKVKKSQISSLRAKRTESALIFTSARRSRPELFSNKGVLRNSSKFTPEAFNLKKRLWHRCFPVNFTNFFHRTPLVAVSRVCQQ